MSALYSILIVDDDASAIVLLGDILKSEGFSVELSYTGHEALAKAQQGKFDVILLDFMLPDMSGEDVCDRIRAMESDVSIILLSGLMSSVNDSSLAKFDKILLKPVHPLKVIKAIRGCVEMIQESPA